MIKYFKLLGLPILFAALNVLVSIVLFYIFLSGDASVLQHMHPILFSLIQFLAFTLINTHLLSNHKTEAIRGGSSLL